jgi:hypothetical protein
LKAFERLADFDLAGQQALGTHRNHQYGHEHGDG